MTQSSTNEPRRDNQAVYDALMFEHMSSFYGKDVAEVYDDTPTVCDIIQPGDDFVPAKGYQATKQMFQDPVFMRGYSLATPHDIRRGDKIRYAVKKGKIIKWVFGGCVKWVDGMTAPDGGWEERSIIRKPQFITLCNPHDKTKSWSVQLHGQRVWLWRLPFVSQKDRQKAVEGIEIVNKLEASGETAETMLSHVAWVASLTSAELFELAKDKRRQENENAKYNVKTVF